MIEPGPSLAELAAAEFEQRRATARRKVAAGELDPHQANLHLLPWLALAARFGADLPELTEDVHIVAPFDREGEPTTSRLLSIDICAPAVTAETLAAARDAAIERADPLGTGGSDPGRNKRALRLSALAIAFGCRPFAPRPKQPQLEAA